MQRRVYVLVLFGFFFLGGASHAHAALLYLDPGTATLHSGDTVTMAVRLDTDDGECVNAVNASLTYDGSVRAVDVSRGNSILSVWVEPPKIDEKNHTITFAGGIPGGYCGRVANDPRLTNIVAEIVFRAPGLVVGTNQSPTAHITFGDGTEVLLNDGLGTRAPLSLQDADITLLNKPGSEVVDDWSKRVSDDTIPPADFAITLAHDPLTFGGKYYIVFSSLDKQSGIDHYDVLEEPFDKFKLFEWGAATAPWRTVTSPYVLKDQSLNSTIYVRAVDKAGNQTVAKLVPDNALRKLSIQRVLMIGILGGVGGIMLVIIGYALWRRKREVEREFDHEGGVGFEQPNEEGTDV